MANGVYWIGQDGNVWVTGDKGTNAAGSYDNNSDNYWSGQGYSRIQDPNAPYNDTAGGGGALVDTGGGGSTSTTTDPLNDVRFLDDQEAAINRLLGRAGI